MNNINSRFVRTNMVASEHPTDFDALSNEECDNLLSGVAAANTDRDSDVEDLIRGIDWRSLRGEPPPRTWWMQDWLSTIPTLLAGSGGIGKSTLVQTICTALAAGLPYLTPAARPLRCMLWACEDDVDELRRRQAMINRYFGITEDDLDNFIAVPRVGMNNTLLVDAYGRPTETNLMGQLEDAIEALRIDVLVIDNIAHTFGGRSENQNHVTHFVNRVYALGRNRPFAPILVGHPSRAEGSEFSGSAAWENATRSRWYLGTHVPGDTPDCGQDTDSDVIYLTQRKANYAPADRRIRLTRTGGMLVPDVGASDPVAHAERLARHEALVLDGLRVLTAKAMPATDAVSSPNYLPKTLIALGMAEGVGRRDLGNALIRLVASGQVLRAVIGKHGNGNPKTILTLAA